MSLGRTLFLTVGLPGSGKTTLAREIADRHRILRLTPDEWMAPFSATATRAADEMSSKAE